MFASRTRPPTPSCFSAWAARRLLSSRQKRIAQPLASTHPHLLSPGELTAGIQSSEYSERRSRLAELLPPGALALFPAAAPGYMSHDVQAPYHQDSDLFYLSGFAEHSSLLACIRPEHGAARWHLFVRPGCPAEEVWDGARAGIDGAQQHILADGEVHALADSGPVLAREVVSGAVTSVLQDTGGKQHDPQVQAHLGPLLDACAERAFSRGGSARSLVQSLRVHKSEAERALMRASGVLCAEAFRAVMCGSLDAAERGLTESVLAAHFEFECRVAGAERLAYPCVVASGVEAVTLHYMHNNAVLRPGSLLLMDAGASYHGYASDITRTWPLSGKFSAAQRDLYDAVLDVNQRIISECRADGKARRGWLVQRRALWAEEWECAGDGMGLARDQEGGGVGLAGE